MIPPDLHESESISYLMEKFIPHDGKIDIDKLMAADLGDLSPDDIIMKYMEKCTDEIAALRVELRRCKEEDEELICYIINLKKEIFNTNLINDQLDTRLLETYERAQIWDELIKEETKMVNLQQLYDSFRSEEINMVFPRDQTDISGLTMEEKATLDPSLKPSASDTNISKADLAQEYRPRSNIELTQQAKYDLDLWPHGWQSPYNNDRNKDTTGTENEPVQGEESDDMLKWNRTEQNVGHWDDLQIQAPVPSPVEFPALLYVPPNDKARKSPNEQIGLEHSATAKFTEMKTEGMDTAKSPETQIAVISGLIRRDNKFDSNIEPGDVSPEYQTRRGNPTATKYVDDGRGLSMFQDDNLIAADLFSKHPQTNFSVGNGPHNGRISPKRRTSPTSIVSGESRTNTPGISSLVKLPPIKNANTLTAYGSSGESAQRSSTRTNSPKLDDTIPRLVNIMPGTMPELRKEDGKGQNATRYIENGTVDSCLYEASAEDENNAKQVDRRYGEAKSSIDSSCTKLPRINPCDQNGNGKGQIYKYVQNDGTNRNESSNFGMGLKHLPSPPVARQNEQHMPRLPVRHRVIKNPENGNVIKARETTKVRSDEVPLQSVGNHLKKRGSYSDVKDTRQNRSSPKKKGSFSPDINLK